MLPDSSIFIGNSLLQSNVEKVKGDFVLRNGVSYYKISHYDQMKPFFMTIVSASDQWMFISSNGGLTAGRKNPQHALFPYYTDDKIHDSAELTGSKTILLVTKADKRYLWEPFSQKYEGIYQLERNLYKSIQSDQIIFEEYNKELQLVFSYSLSQSNGYGLVKKAQITSSNESEIQVQVLDGIQNLLPYGVNLSMQTELSTLIDAYKKNELETETGLGIFRLSSILVDRPEPSEALKSTTVWSAGLENTTYLLCANQLDKFRKGEPLAPEKDVRAERGAFFVHSSLVLTPKQKKDWYIVAELGQGPSEVASLTSQLSDRATLVKNLQKDLAEGSEKLMKIVASADGLQLTADRLSNNRHFSNVLFNVMRGGVFDHHYSIAKDDLSEFLMHFNTPITKKHASFIQKLPDTFSVFTLLESAELLKDNDFLRLCYEYLPLTFSRRHGDPSRPWNFFSIEVQKEDGSKTLNYQGNWRDIFQNWEALCTSYPEFTASIIAKFVNASTADGYNPYRITREGIDWEKTDPNDPWSYIGYWGDHQVVYLLKLLETCQKHHPKLLEGFLSKEMFVYANVPYRIVPFDDLLKDPHNTIHFDQKQEDEIQNRVTKVGADGKLIWNKNGNTYKVNLTEKLLVTALAKLSNFIPEAGIWMNTQRPEWNDANNALVGYGVSMVTLYYLRRFQFFCQKLFSEAKHEYFSISLEVSKMLKEIIGTFEKYKNLLKGPISNKDRKNILQGLGSAGSKYRLSIYEGGFSGYQVSVSKNELLKYIDLSIAYIDHAITANKRTDHLFHSYNLMSVQGQSEIRTRQLYEMLEGQVAVLSSGFLSVKDSVSLLESLKSSALYREDQYSYMLYPNRILPRFTEKNIIPPDYIHRSELLIKLLKANNRKLIEQDVLGEFHFNGDFHNSEGVKTALQDLSENGFAQLVEKDSELILEIFEEMFDHQSFTGRSGTFFGYEGLGSIYWHMVSKLLLAVCEVYYRAIEEEEKNQSIQGKLIEYYYEIRAGIGLNKNPKLYGAFPTDPYSHTPGNAGVQQPGMTGQVKEDILSRMGELGISVKEGQIHFQPVLLRKNEFLRNEHTFHYYSVDGKKHALMVPADSLAFTYCQVPIIYSLSNEEKIEITDQSGQQTVISGRVIPITFSNPIFKRKGSIEKIIVSLNPLL